MTNVPVVGVVGEMALVVASTKNELQILHGKI